MNKRAKILIADDSEFMRKVLMGILEDSGFQEIVECSDGRDCLDKYEAESPDLVLLDIIMPVMDGMEVIKKIGKKVNVIIISAIGQEKIMEEARLYGALGYVVKPFDKEQVIGEISKILK